MIDLKHYGFGDKISAVMISMVNELAKSMMRQHLTGSSTDILKRWQRQFPVSTINHQGLFEVIEKIHTARVVYGVSNEQGLSVLNDPLSWANLDVHLRQKDSVTDARVPSERVINRQGFFAPVAYNPNREILMYAIMALCSLLVNASSLYQFCFTSTEKQNPSLNPFHP